MEAKPGVKECPVQQGAVVVIAHKVRNLHLSGAGGRSVVGVDLDAVVRVPHIQQQNIKMEDGVRRDEIT